MTTTYTGILRLALPGVGDTATRNAWGGLLNTNDGLLEAAITGTVSVSLTGQTAYTLTAANGATDQSRPMGIIFTGFPGSGTCVVTIPSVVRLAYVKNASSGPVSLTTGAGASLALAANTNGVAEYLLPWTAYYCDGTNVSLAQNPARGSLLFTTPSSTTTWTPGAILQAKFTLVGQGGTGGNASSPSGGGGGGGGGAITAWVPITQGETFTLAISGGAAQITTSASDVNLQALAGQFGSGATPGAAGSTLNSSSRAFINVLAVSGSAGQPGYYAWNNIAYVSGGGAGGNSGLGGAGHVSSVGSAVNSVSTAAASVAGVGGGGGFGYGMGGAGGPALITVEW